MRTMHADHSTDRWLIALGLAAAAALAAALALQYLGGYDPAICAFSSAIPISWCWWPAARPVAGLAAAGPGRVSPGAGDRRRSGRLFHVGVEQGWFALPESCAAVGRATSTRGPEGPAARRHRHAAIRCRWPSWAFRWRPGTASMPRRLLVAALLGLRRTLSAAEQDRQPRIAHTSRVAPPRTISRSRECP